MSGTDAIDIEDETHEKMGLDDFIIKYGALKLRTLLDSPNTCQRLTFIEELWRLNKEWAVVTDTENVIHLKTKNISLIKNLSNKLKKDVFDLVLDNNGNVSHRKVNPASVWVNWPLRNQVDKIVYDPRHAPLSVVEIDGRYVYNIWPGLRVTRKKGDVTRFLKLIDHLFEGTEPEAKHHFLQWLAFPLQNPGAKLSTCYLLFGLAQGTGKSTIGYTMRLIYGENFKEIKERHFQADFNDWAAYKQFVLADEISSAADKKISSREIIKNLITQETISVNKKFLAEFEIADTINYLLTSNQPDAFILEDNDRRLNVVEIYQTNSLGDDFFDDYYKWAKEEGASHILDFLLEYDLTGFNHKAPAMKTVAKAVMTLAGKNDVAMFCKNLKDFPKETLKCDRLGNIEYPLDFVSSATVKIFFDEIVNKPQNAYVIGKEMARAGFKHLYKGNPIKVNGRVNRYFIIKNEQFWANAHLNQIKNHIVSEGANTFDEEGNFIINKIVKFD